MKKNKETIALTNKAVIFTILYIVCILLIVIAAINIYNKHTSSPIDSHIRNLYEESDKLHESLESKISSVCTYNETDKNYYLNDQYKENENYSFYNNLICNELKRKVDNMKSMPIFEKREEINHKNYNYNKSIATAFLNGIYDLDNENKTTINNIIKSFQSTATINEDLYEIYTHDNFFPIHGKKYMMKTYYNNTKLELEAFKVIDTIYNYALSEISKK